VTRLHHSGVKRIYWTENGKGMDPEARLDVVSGSVVVAVVRGSGEFSVPYQEGHQIERFAIAGSPLPNPPSAPAFSWSKGSNLYHHSNCSVVKRISPANLQTGDQPPEGRTLHSNCPLVNN
jgi:hypothetical protein